MRKCFASNPANTGRPETDAGPYYFERSTTLPLNIIFSARDTGRRKSLFFQLHGCKQQPSQKTFPDRSKLNSGSLITHYFFFFTIAKPFF